MANSQTEHYGLNQWAAEDPVLREEFNHDNAKIDALLTSLSNRFFYGTYNCDGTYGEEHPITLTFPFKPKVLFLAPLDASVWSYAWITYGTTRCYIHTYYNSGDFLTLSWNGNSVTYYAEKNATVQYNYSGKTLYLALG